MKSVRTLIALTGLLLWTLLLLTENAYAYLDPGTGSYFLQILMAALLGAAFSIKMYWARLRMMFKGDSSKEAKQ